MNPLVVVLVALSLAYVLAEACARRGIPRVVGQITAGVLLGLPVLNALVFDSASLGLISLLADIGILLLFFFVGLEVNLREFRKNLPRALPISLFNTLLPLVAGFFAARAFGLDVVASVVLGISLSVSSQAAAFDFLEELKLLKSRVGTLIITAGAVDDVVELFLITIVLALLHASLGGADLAMLAVGTLVFLAFTVAFRLFLLPRVLDVFERSKSSTALFTGGILLTLFMAALAEFLGVGALIGAFIAGVIVRHALVAKPHPRPWEEHSLSKSVHVIAFGFFVPLLFVWVGLNVDLASTLAHWPFALAITLIAIIGTVGGTVLGVLASGGTAREGYLVGWGVNSKGDVELVIATLALQNALITRDVYSAIVLMAFATTLISPIVFRHLVQRHARG